MPERLPHDAGIPDERVWEKGWGGHEQHQRERLARLPLAEKLDWLETTHRLLEHLNPASDSKRTSGFGTP